MRQKIIFRPQSTKYYVGLLGNIVLLIGCAYIGYHIFLLKQLYIGVILLILLFIHQLIITFQKINYRIIITKEYISAPIPVLGNEGRFQYKVFKRDRIYFREVETRSVSSFDLEKVDETRGTRTRFDYPFLNICLGVKNGSLKRIDILYFSDQQREEIIKIINGRLKENHLGKKDEFAGN